MTAHAHIVLVSAQAAPNLLPVLDLELKPEEVILLVSARMKLQADALEKVFQQVGVKTTRIQLANEHDFAELEKTLMELACERDGQSLALNVTGGTKLMALAAQSISVEAGWPVFYVDVDTDEIIWLGKNMRPSRKLTEQLRLCHYLMGYGYTPTNRIDRPQTEVRHNELLDTLLLQIGSLEHPLSQLNWLAQQAENARALQIELDTHQRDNHGLDTLLRIFETAGVLSVAGSKLSFANEDQRDFAKGGWLEHYVFRTVSGLTKELKIRDKAANLELADPNGVKNELDVAFMAKNRLFVVECKTARMDRPEAPKANDTLFKLSEICRRVGGLGTRGMLASYRALREPEKKLARALNIELVCGAELTRLDEKLKEWAR